MDARERGAVEPNCLCGCTADAHPVRGHEFVFIPSMPMRVIRGGCDKLGPDGRKHCYGYVSPEDEIDA